MQSDMSLKVSPLSLIFETFDLPQKTLHINHVQVPQVFVLLCACVYSVYTVRTSLQVSTICTVQYQYVVGLLLKGFPLAHCRGGSFQSMGGWRQGEGQGVSELGWGRGSRERLI